MKGEVGKQGAETMQRISNSRMLNAARFSQSLTRFGAEY